MADDGASQGGGSTGDPGAPTSDQVKSLVVPLAGGDPGDPGPPVAERTLDKVVGPAGEKLEFDMPALELDEVADRPRAGA